MCADYCTFKVVNVLFYLVDFAMQATSFRYTETVNDSLYKMHIERNKYKKYSTLIVHLHTYWKQRWIQVKLKLR